MYADPVDSFWSRRACRLRINECTPGKAFSGTHERKGELGVVGGNIPGRFVDAYVGAGILRVVEQPTRRAGREVPLLVDDVLPVFRADRIRCPTAPHVEEAAAKGEVDLVGLAFADYGTLRGGQESVDRRSLAFAVAEDVEGGVRVGTGQCRVVSICTGVPSRPHPPRLKPVGFALRLRTGHLQGDFVGTGKCPDEAESSGRAAC